MRWRFWGLLVAVIALLPVAPARGATMPVVFIDGQGWGHGVGMAQDGAFWMGKAGASTPQILGQFYPGTALAKMTPGDVRVAVFSGTAITLAFPNGGRIDERGSTTPGFPVRIDPGGSARVRWTGAQLIVEPIAAARTSSTAAPTTTTTTSPPPPTTVPSQSKSAQLLPPASTTTTTPPRQATNAPSAPQPSWAATAQSLVATTVENGTVSVVDKQRRYRGFLDIVPTASGLRLVNQLPVEQYLRGMGEVRDPSWPAAALRTQAIAARTYALRAMAAAGEICDGQRCQVYLGQQAEDAAMDKAVAATAGQVLMYNRSLASAVYSANAGGHSATREEGFGTTGGNYPYLRAAPYETKNPMPWTATLKLSEVAARLGRPDATAIEVTETGPSGRALAVAVDGPDGRSVVTGRAFAATLGLRSTRFVVKMGTADSAEPLPAGSVLQAAPDEIATADAPIATAPATELAASPVELPDRPRVLATAAPAGAGRAASALRGFLALLAAVGLLLAVSWRRPALAATLRSWRDVRRRAGDRS